MKLIIFYFSVDKNLVPEYCKPSFSFLYFSRAIDVIGYLQ